MDSQGLTFQWVRLHWFCPRLALSLGLSAFGHLLVCLLFLIETKSKVTSPSPAPEISLLNASNPEHQPLLRWVESESPVGSFAHQLLPSEGLANTAYQYSFASSRVTPKTPDRWIPAPPVPLAKLPARPNSPAASPAPSFSGSLHFSPNLQKRVTAKIVIPPTPVTQLLEPSTFLLGVESSGKVTFAMLQKSSGSPVSDARAEAFLREQQFERTASELEWGSATLTWANR